MPSLKEAQEEEEQPQPELQQQELEASGAGGADAAAAAEQEEAAAEQEEADPSPIGDDLTLQDAQRLFDSGCSALRADDYDQAADCLSRALEVRARHYGELALECAHTYYKYGCALLYKVQAESDALNDPGSMKNSTEPTASNGIKEKGEAEQDGEEAEGEHEEEEAEEDLEEEESDLDLSWKMLDIARAIYEKQQCHSIEEVDVITALADVSLEREDFEMCFRDYTKALEILEGLVEPDNRRIAELCFKLSLAQQLGYKPKEALRYCQQAVSLCEARLQRLRSEVAVSKGTSDVKGKSILSENLTEKTDNETLQQSTVEKEAPAKSNETSEAASCKDQEEEIKEIEQLLEELREKVVELEEMATAPSLLEALKVANPAAVNSIQQVFTVTAKLASGDTSAGSSSRAESSNGGFDAPSCHAASSAPVTHLGVVGRGVKRAAPVPVSSAGNGHELLPKRRTLADMMTGGGTGETQIGFGASTVVVKGGVSSANGQPVNPPPSIDEAGQECKTTDPGAEVQVE